MFDALKSSEHPTLIYFDFDSTLNQTGFFIDTDSAPQYFIDKSQSV